MKARKELEYVLPKETFVLEFTRDELYMLLAVLGKHVSHESLMPKFYSQIVGEVSESRREFNEWLENPYDTAPGYPDEEGREQDYKVVRRE